LVTLNNPNSIEMPRIIQTLKPLDENTKDKCSITMNSMDYFEAVYEACRHLQLGIGMNDSTEETYSHSISLMENALAETGWKIETSADFPYEDLHMMSLHSQRNQNVSL